MTSSHPQVQWAGYPSCTVIAPKGTRNDTHRHGDGDSSLWFVVECLDVVLVSVSMGLGRSLNLFRLARVLPL
jgi:hypothetical protein